MQTIKDFIKGKQVSTTIELPFGLCDVKNPQNMRFNCWVYEATPELLAAFDALLKEDQNNG